MSLLPPALSGKEGQSWQSFVLLLYLPVLSPGSGLRGVCGGCAALAQLWLLKRGSGPLRSAGVCPTLAERGGCHLVT